MPYQVVNLPTMLITTSGEYTSPSSSGGSTGNIIKVGDDAEMIWLFPISVCTSQAINVLVEPTSTGTDWVKLTHMIPSYTSSGAGAYHPIVDLSTASLRTTDLSTFPIPLPAFKQMMLGTGPTTTTQTKILVTKKVLV